MLKNHEIKKKYCKCTLSAVTSQLQNGMDFLLSFLPGESDPIKSCSHLGDTIPKEHAPSITRPSAPQR